jgi:hypothetical protein
MAGVSAFAESSETVGIASGTVELAQADNTSVRAATNIKSTFFIFFSP